MKGVQGQRDFLTNDKAFQEAGHLRPQHTWVCSRTSTITCTPQLLQGYISHVAVWGYKVTTKIFVIPHFQ